MSGPLCNPRCFNGATFHSTRSPPGWLLTAAAAGSPALTTRCLTPQRRWLRVHEVLPKKAAPGQSWERVEDVR